MSSQEYDNAVYAEICSETKKMEEDLRYEVPRKILQKNPPCRHNEKMCIDSSRCTNNCCAIALTITVVVVLLGVVAACIGFALEITKLKREIVSNGQKLSDRLDNVIPINEMVSSNKTSVLQQALNSISERLENMTQTSVSQQALDTLSERLDNVTVQVTEDYTNKIQQLASSSYTSYYTRNLSVQCIRRSKSKLSCFLMLCSALPLLSPSGYYWVRASNGSAVRVY